MDYQHILVALGSSEESKVLVDRAVSLAKLVDAKVSLIHIDGTHGEIYPELIDLQKEHDGEQVNERSKEMYQTFSGYTDFPISHFLVGTGDLGNKLEDTIAEHGFDLLICGHHHDFWNNIISYSKRLINKSPIETLVVPI